MGLIKREYTDNETLITAENLNAIQDSIIDLEKLGPDAIISTASGDVIAVSDSSAKKLVGFSVYGKSTQDGTPTPDAPVDIVSVCDGGTMTCKLFGKNLFDASMLNLTNNKELSVLDDGYTIVATGGKGVTYASSRYDLPISLRGKNLCLAVDSISATTQKVVVSAQVNVETPSKMDYFLVTPERNTISFTVPSNATRITVCVYTNNSSTTLSEDNTVTVKGLRLVHAKNKADGWTKAVGEQGIALGHVLRGVPVTNAALATYTDANGQMWCADEIDLERGVLVQRVAKGVLTNPAGYFELGTYARFSLNFSQNRSIQTPNGLCNIAKMIGDYNLDELHFYVQNTQAWMFVPINELTTKDANGVRSWLEEKGAEYYYILATPIETALTDEEMATYKALHTNKPNTTVLNDSGAYMDLEYVVDTKTYIDNHIISGGGSVARLTSITLLASSWTGSNSLYSQVVSIPGITEYSKVDLLPSVEQLAIFHNKDVAFVTENEDGVVTVYAIGDKPTLDYTMQAQITEVLV